MPCLSINEKSIHQDKNRSPGGNRDPSDVVLYGVVDECEAAGLEGAVGVGKRLTVAFHEFSLFIVLVLAAASRILSRMTLPPQRRLIVAHAVDCLLYTSPSPRD